MVSFTVLPGMRCLSYKVRLFWIAGALSKFVPAGEVTENNDDHNRNFAEQV